MAEFLPALITLLPLIILAFVLRWVRQIKNTMILQVKQNEEIISLLKKLGSNQ